MNILPDPAAQRAVESRFHDARTQRRAALHEIEAKGGQCDFRDLDTVERYLNRFPMLGRADAATELAQAAAAGFAAERGLEASALSESMLGAIDQGLETQGPFNCELVVPQSWSDKRAPMRADLHHLFTCEPGCNSFRSNIPYFDFSPADEARLRGTEVDMEAALLDDSIEAARNACGIREGRKFEPDAGKGPAARATLYFLLRYPGEVGDIKSGAKLELTKSRLKVLTKWAADEPPGAYERHHNAEIARVQSNRNPLIDRPDWLKKINFEFGFG